MPNRKIIKASKYQKIAVGVAQKIASGEYEVGELIKSRSTLASKFGVSPETTRRALNILADLHIVALKQGSGAIVLSKEKALEFVENFQETHDIQMQKDAIIDKINEQEQALAELKGMVSVYLDQTRILSKRYPLDPFGIKLTADCDLLGKQLADAKVWHQTGAVVVAIERNHELLIAPSPYQTFEKDDLVYFIGETPSYQRMLTIFNLNK